MRTGEYQSGQMGQTVNLLAYAFGGSNPSSPTTKVENCGSSSVDRALAFQAEGRGFEPRLPLQEESQRWLSFFVGETLMQWLVCKVIVEGKVMINGIIPND